MRLGRLALIVSLLLTLPLTGCWGKVEVEELGFVLAMGIDLGKDPGTFNVTYQMGIPKKGGEGGGSQIQSLTYTVEAGSMRESMEKIFNLSSRRPFVGTVKVLVIGRDLAKEGINQVLDFFQRYYEFRRTIFLVLARGTAQDLLNVETRHDNLAAMNIEALINQADNTSVFPVVRLGHYLTVLDTGSTAPVLPLAYPLKSGEEGVRYPPQDSKGKAQEIKLAGAGVLKGDRLAGTLTDKETRGYLWLRNEVKYRFLTARWGEGEENYFISVRVTNAETDWKLEPVEGGYGIHYTIKVKWDLDEFSGPQKQRTPEEWLKLAGPKGDQLFTQLIQEECEEAINRSKEMGLDFLGIGRHIEEKNPKYWQEIKDNWQETLKDFPVTVDVEVNPRTAGSSFNPPSNPPGTGEE